MCHPEPVALSLCVILSLRFCISVCVNNNKPQVKERGVEGWEKRGGVRAQELLTSPGREGMTHLELMERQPCTSGAKSLAPV